MSRSLLIIVCPGHKLRLFTLWEAQFVTVKDLAIETIIREPDEVNALKPVSALHKEVSVTIASKIASVCRAILEQSRSRVVVGYLCRRNPWDVYPKVTVTCMTFLKGYGSDHTMNVPHPSRRAHAVEFDLFQYILFERKMTLQLPYCCKDLRGQHCKGAATARRAYALWSVGDIDRYMIEEEIATRIACHVNDP